MSLYEQVRVRVCPRGSSRAAGCQRGAGARTRAHVRARAHIRARGHQIILELLELREVDVARAMLRQTECMLTMKQEQPERHMRLEALASRPIWCVRACHVWSVSGDGRGGVLTRGVRCRGNFKNHDTTTHSLTQQEASTRGVRCRRAKVVAQHRGLYIKHTHNDEKKLGTHARRTMPGRLRSRAARKLRKCSPLKSGACALC